MAKKHIVPLLFLIGLLCCCFLTGCGKNGRNDPESPTTLPASQLSASDARFIFIALDECYPPEQCTLMICRADDKKRENPTVLTYDEGIGGYGILLEEGSYEIRLVCDAPGVTYDQHRYIVVNEDHSYYHIRFTETSHQSFD